MTDNW